MTLQTLLLLQSILHAQQLDGRAEDFEIVATAVLTARRELADAIAAAQETSP